MSMTQRPSRRLTALATLAFAGTITGGAAGATPASAAAKRSTPPMHRAGARVANESSATGSARLELPAELDLDGLAAEIGVHPGRLAAALRTVAPDETRSTGGLDPLTALANALGLPATDVYLAVARHAARGSK